ncbi:Unknown protein [Striga hermonthica]|uniref:Uncharacterized protein n=1 Tax=Striga hermonthica TaxID=68872 RepID=A0A9N7MG84_STRHE|nr:Unknown protein [Striga hermonthica]
MEISGEVHVSESAGNCSTSAQSTPTIANSAHSDRISATGTENVELPLKTPPNLAVVSFFYPPTSKDCTVLGIQTPSYENISRIHVLGHGKKKKKGWSGFVQKTASRFLPSRGAQILYRGLVYFSDIKGNVASGVSRIQIGFVQKTASRFMPSRGAPILYRGLVYFSDMKGNVASGVARIQIYPRLTNALSWVKGLDGLFRALAFGDECKVRVYRLLEELKRWNLVENFGDKFQPRVPTHTTPSSSSTPPTSGRSSSLLPTSLSSRFSIHPLEDCTVLGIQTPSYENISRIHVLGHGKNGWPGFVQKTASRFLPSRGAQILYRGLVYFSDIKGNVASGVSRIQIGFVQKTASRFMPSRGAPILYRGLVYFSDMKGNVASGVARIQIYPRLTNALSWVKGLDGLFRALAFGDECKVRVYRLLEELKRWNLVENFGDKVLYLSSFSSTRLVQQPRPTRLCCPNFTALVLFSTRAKMRVALRDWILPRG